MTRAVSALHTLELSGCEELTDLAPLAELHALHTLNLSWCASLTDLAPLADLHALHTLNLGGCEALKDLVPLAGLRHLTTLNLCFCKELTDLAPLAGLNALTTLHLSSCAALTDLAPLAGLNALTTLDLSSCEALKDLAPLAGLQDLTTLSLSGWDSLTDLAPLAGVNALTTLDVSYCKVLTDLAPLAGLHALTTLNLSNCAALTDLAPLAGLNALTTLNLSWCDALADFAPIAGCQALQSLDLQGCNGLTELSPVASLPALRSLDVNCNKLLTRVAALRSCRLVTRLELTVDCGNIRDLDTLSEMASLRELTWTETAAPHSVLAATAVLRGDVDTVQESAGAWLTSVALSKAPDTFGLRLVRAFVLGGNAPWAANALTELATALRDRAGNDDDAAVIQPATWAAWADAVLALDDEGLRAALDAALADLDPTREIDPVLTPLLTALADLGPASPRVRRPAPEWLVPRVRAVLAAVAERPDPARRAAPAAAVFFAGFGLDADVRAWLERGTHADAPHWRDRVVLALLGREARNGDLPGARRWAGQLATDEGRDEGRATLAQAFAARLPAEAAAELDAIGDESLRARVALQLGKEPALLAEPAGLYALVLALQDDAQALGDTLSALVEAHADSALVAALARDLAPPAAAEAPVSGGPDPATIAAHPAWREEVAGRKWDAFTGRLPSGERLLAEAIAARAVAVGLLEEDAAEEIVARLG